MPTPQELEAKFWKSLKSDMTMMLGLDGVDQDGHARPMTAQFENDTGPIWFFTATDNAIVKKLPQGNRAIATFASLKVSMTCSRRCTAELRAMTTDAQSTDFGIDLWRPGFEGGKDDPKLALLRLDPEKAEIWLDESSIIAGIKMLLGADPKTDYKDKVAKVSLR